MVPVDASLFENAFPSEPRIMRLFRLSVLPFAFYAAPVAAQTSALNTTFARDPQQAINQEYTDHIHKYTTDPSFTSPLVDYLPASKDVPTPAKVLGDVSGARTCCLTRKTCTNTSDCCRRQPAREGVTIGHSEEGREMIAVAIADAAAQEGRRSKQRLAQLADPRTIGSTTPRPPLIDQSYPVYYITGTIHSTKPARPQR